MDLHRFTIEELMIGNMYGEARMIEGDMVEDDREYLAIGCVVRNRVLSLRFPNSYHEVILQRRQFSWANEGDPNRSMVIEFLMNGKDTKTYKRMKAWAKAIIENKTTDFSNGADHYVAQWLYEKEEKQHWIDDMKITAVWGGHVFLRSKQ